MTEKTTVAVVTGGHGFDIPNLHALFRSLDGIEAYVQHLDDFASSSQQVRDGYDAVLFYFMPREAPVDEGLPSYAGKPQSALEHLGETRQGIVVLHHALLAYTQWPLWGDLVGLGDRSLSSYHHDQMIRTEVSHRTHPITQGLEAWDMVDETYLMHDAGPGNEVLLHVEHPKSMKTLAWTRPYRNGRVFCYVCGHDNQCWSHPSFRTVLTRGIRWAAGRI